VTDSWDADDARRLPGRATGARLPALRPSRSLSGLVSRYLPRITGDRARRERGRVTLVGTVHFSPASARRAAAVVQDRDPDVVAIELDPLRYRTFRAHEPLSALRLRRDGASCRALLFYLLFGRGRPPFADAGRDVGAGPAGPAEPDALVAARAATAQGADLALVDRPAVETYDRLAAVLLARSTIRTVVGLAADPARRGEWLDRVRRFVDALVDLGIDREDEDGPLDLLDWFESLSAEETDALVAAFRTAFPAYGRVVLDERDQHVAGRLLWLRDRGYDVVAVVGKAHVGGVRAALAAPETVPADLVAPPPVVASPLDEEGE
jgi:pheromone shutdown protein TraB